MVANNGRRENRKRHGRMVKRKAKKIKEKEI